MYGIFAFFLVIIGLLPAILFIGWAIYWVSQYVYAIFLILSCKLFGTSRKKKKFPKIMSKEAHRRESLLKETFRNFIISFQDRTLPSCEEELMSMYRKEIQEENFDDWDGSEDIQKIALFMIENFTFNMVTSGQYHIYAGVLSPVGRQLRRICTTCIEKTNQYGYATKEESDALISSLSSCIRDMG